MNGLQRLGNVFILKERAAELLQLLSEHDLEMDELLTCLKRVRVYFEKTAGDLIKIRVMFCHQSERNCRDEKSLPTFEVSN